MPLCWAWGKCVAEIANRLPYGHCDPRPAMPASLSRQLCQLCVISVNASATTLTYCQSKYHT